MRFTSFWWLFSGRIALNFSCLIRGLGKGYALLMQDQLAELVKGSFECSSTEFSLMIEIGGRTAQAEIAPFTSRDKQGIILVFPLLERTMDLVLLHGVKEGQPYEIFRKQIKPEKLKWESRINYRTKRDLALQIRDAEWRNRLTHESVVITDIVPFEGADVVRGVLTIPHCSSAQPDLKIYDYDLNPIEATPISLGASSSANKFASKVEITKVGFSVLLESGAANKLFVTVPPDGSGIQSSFLNVDQTYRNELVSTYQSITQNAETQPDYDEWLKQHQPTDEDLFLQGITDFEYEPLISIVTPLYKTPLSLFDEMVESVRSQTYPNWELVLVNASPEDVALCDLVAKKVSEDSRIHVVTMDENLGITLNTDAGIKECHGEFIGFLDHDDLLEPNALFEYVSALNQDPGIDVLYCDEDKIKDGVRFDPYFKPDLSLFLMREVNYICHFLMVRKSLLDQVVHDDARFDGAQDHNLILQCLEKTDKVKHVSKILYTWRITDVSTAGGTDAKPYADIAGKLAIEEHLQRQGVNGIVEGTCDNCRYHVRYAVQGNPKVSIIIPNKDNSEILRNCIGSIRKESKYDNYEIIIVENNSVDEPTFEAYKELESSDGKVRVVCWDKEFNFSAINNFGVKHATGEYLLFLNNDTEVITPEWLETMLGICQQPQVGIVGAKLLYPDMLIQHAGVYVQGEGAGHLGLNLERHARGYFSTVRTTHELSAVTAACMMVDAKVFNEVGGFDEDYAVAFNDVDLCMKVRAAGKLVIYSPLVELLHYESISRGYEDTIEKALRFNKEATLLRHRWSDQYVLGDPYINYNLHRDNCYYAFG